MKSSIASGLLPSGPLPASARALPPGLPRRPAPSAPTGTAAPSAAAPRPRTAGLLALAIGLLLSTLTLPATAQSTVEPVERLPQSTQRDRNAIKLQSDAIESIKTLLGSGRTSEALQVAEKALRQFPANVQMRFLYGVALTDSGETDQAIKTFTELTQSHPELAEPYNNLAVIHASAGNLIGARDALEQAVVAVPDYPLASENLGDLYIRLAVQVYQKGTENESAGAALRRKLVLARELLAQITPSAPAK